MSQRGGPETDPSFDVEGDKSTFKDNPGDVKIISLQNLTPAVKLISVCCHFFLFSLKIC